MLCDQELVSWSHNCSESWNLIELDQKYGTYIVMKIKCLLLLILFCFNFTATAVEDAYHVDHHDTVASGIEQTSDLVFSQAHNENGQANSDCHESICCHHHFHHYVTTNESRYTSMMSVLLYFSFRQSSLPLISLEVIKPPLV